MKKLSYSTILLSFFVLSPIVAWSSASDEKEEGSNDQMGEKILVAIVDDNKVVRLLTKMLFKEEGCKCVEFEDGQDVKDYKKFPEFDVVIMDESMPKISGIETARYLRDAQYTGFIVFASDGTSLTEEDRLLFDMDAKGKIQASQVQPLILTIQEIASRL